ncbi:MULTISPECIES: ABC transporter permease [Inquilinus]|uniref:Peptide/nickel transport system permease protein n=1 Tax=Inquilinus ginsengisoli TaxID=363840 RepID=A0ABU1JQB1_9PROT|nr:ABC transporter permease [Inquilinus ginsengisoli]MDR6290814.1 peptide/nickel transport system permease protein [Inquilinus ginsengisoli]
MRYVIRRLLQSLIVVFGVSVVAFGMLFMTGDPTEVILRDAADHMTVAQIEEFRVKMGFDRPWYVQYFSFVGNAVQGDFGYSFIRHQPAYEVITDKLPATIRLASFAFVLSLLVSIPLGVMSAIWVRRPIDHIATVLALIGQSIPSFWLGILLILLFGVHLKWLPISGSGTWQHLIMPGVSLAAFPIARNMRLTRSSMLDFMRRDFVRTARAKGISETRVVYAHVLRNSLLPIVTAIGLELGFLLGGSVIIETIFGWPGVGREIVSAIGSKDFYVVQAGVVMLALIFAAVNLLVDLAYSWIDPRIRHSS